MNNALPGFTDTDVKQLLETAGVASFVSDTGFYQVINGILVQVGRTGSVSSGATIPFHAGFTKQVLGVFVTPITSTLIYDTGVNTVTLTNFKIYLPSGPSSVYWLALGV